MRREAGMQRFGMLLLEHLILLILAIERDYS